MSKKNKVKAKSKGSEKKAPKGYEPSVADQHLVERIAEPKVDKSTKKKRQAWADESGRLTKIINSDAKKKVRQQAKADLEKLQAEIDASTEARHSAAPVLEVAQSPEEIAAIVDEALAVSRAALDDVNAATDADLKARVQAKKAARRLSPDDADKVDRGDALAVWAWNETHGKDSGHYITSDAEKAMRDAAVSEVESKPVAETSAQLAEADADGRPAYRSADLPIVTAVEGTTEESVGGLGFAVPSDTPQIERDRYGRPKLLNIETGEVQAYTRMTTFIDNLEDKTTLEKWKLRTLLEGVVLSDLDERLPDFVFAAGNAIRHRDDELARIDKKDRKGKLKPGQRGELEDAVAKEYKSTLDSIAHEALEAGGVHEKAQKGTDLHALAQGYDESGLSFDAWAETVDDTVTPADIADIRAYADAMAKAGIKVIECEAFVVNDQLGAAGTFDRSVYYKAEGAQRAARVVADIKTGNVEYGIGKIAQQIKGYADGKGYDPARPTEREDKKLSKTLGLLIHLPQGKAECHIYEVDLTLGARGNKLSGEVRTWRNESKKAYNLKAPIVSVVPEVVA